MIDIISCLSVPSQSFPRFIYEGKLILVVIFLLNMGDSSGSNEYPDTLQGFGYDFNKDGKLRKLHPVTNELGDEGFEFNVANDQEKNQRHYEALGEVLTNYIYDLLETDGQLHRLDVPISSAKERSNDTCTPKSFIFVSNDALTNPERLLILIHGSGVVRAGQWARSLIINDSLKTGSQLPYIHRARELGYGVMVLNTNDNTRIINGKSFEIKHSEDPHRHAQYVWKTYVGKAKARHIAIVAHSYGGAVVMDLIKENLDEFRKRVIAIAFTDSVFLRPDSKAMAYLLKVSRNWVSSEKPLDTVIGTPSKNVPRVSAGTVSHELSSSSCLQSAMTFVLQRDRAAAEAEAAAAAADTVAPFWRRALALVRPLLPFAHRHQP